ncbi:MAG: bifunctional riboflavin kinase/FAD synthetase [Oscillospiraceae bacterium]
MEKTAIALGFFDGIHLGHAELIKRTCQRARELSVTPTVLTFDTHPDTFVTGKPVELLTDSEARADIIRRRFGVENVLFIHFNETVMHMSWREFLDLLCAELSAVYLIVGHDYHFGYKGEGNSDLLRSYCEANGIGCDVIRPVERDGAVISSTRIRELVKRGEIEAANALLGHPHELCGTVYYGYKLGHKIGFPTINMRVPENVIVPRFGVYATRVYFGSETHMAVTNVGVRPTFHNGNEPSVESYILDYSGNLYGRRVRVEFYAFLRPERQFESVDALKRQIALDEAATRRFFDAQ